MPFLAWDLINEPSFSQHLWKMRPNGDAIELAAWNRWLSERYPDRAKLAALWNVSPELRRGNDLSSHRRRVLSARHVYRNQLTPAA